MNEIICSLLPLTLCLPKTQLKNVKADNDIITRLYLLTMLNVETIVSKNENNPDINNRLLAIFLL